HRLQPSLPYRVRSAQLGPIAGSLRFPEPEWLQDFVGPRPPWHRPQSVCLSPQPERPDHRTVLRARSDERRGARLLRAAPVAPRQPAASESLGEGSFGIKSLGPRSAGRDDEVTRLGHPGARPISAFTRVFDALWPRTRDPELVPAVCVSGMTNDPQPYNALGNQRAICGNRNIRTISTSGASRNGTIPL